MAVLFYCFGETFSYMWVKLSGTPYCLPSFCLPTLFLLLAPLLEATQMRPVAFTCVNFPLAAPQFSASFYFPKGNHQMLAQSAIPMHCAVELCLGLPQRPPEMSTGAWQHCLGWWAGLHVSSKCRQKQEILLLCPQSRFLAGGWAPSLSTSRVLGCGVACG